MSSRRTPIVGPLPIDRVRRSNGAFRKDEKMLLDKQIRIVEYDLSEPIGPFDGKADDQVLKVLVRFRGKPVGQLTVPAHTKMHTSDDLMREIIKKQTPNLVQKWVRNKLENTLESTHFDISELIQTPVPANETSQPLTTIAVCTRDRAENLTICLNAISKLD